MTGLSEVFGKLDELARRTIAVVHSRDFADSRKKEEKDMAFCLTHIRLLLQELDRSNRFSGASSGMVNLYLEFEGLVKQIRNDREQASRNDRG